MTGESPLVSTDWLAENLDASDLRIFDCTVHLRPAEDGPYAIETGRSEYEAGHVPGAGFLDLTRDLSDQDAPLPFTMPRPDALAGALGAAGIGDDTRVVLYTSTAMMWASRVWWMLRSIGFENAAVLDGGLPKWAHEGRSISTDARPLPATTLTPHPRVGLWADKQEVLISIGDNSVCTLNALPSGMHSGEAEMSYGRKGHIKGSVNVPYDTIVAEDGAYLGTAALKEAFGEAGALDRDRVICYCGGGIAATMDALALTMLGHRNVAVYDGSMTEWAADPDLPMETGA